MLISRCGYRFQSILYYLHYNFQHLVLYSTKSPNQSNNSSPNQLNNSSSNQSNNSSPNRQIYADYLVNNLGFYPQQAISTANKFCFKYCNYFKFCDNANSIVDFLKQHDFDDTHIINMVISDPRILTCQIDKTLKPKFKLLRDHGFSGFDLVSVLSKKPKFLFTDLHTIINDVKEIMGSHENLMNLFKSPRFFMNPSALINIALLKNEYGVDNKAIRYGIRHYSDCYVRKPEFFRNMVIKVEEELGIPRDSSKFLRGVYLLCGLPKESIELKCQLLKSFGWTEYDVSELMRKQPFAFKISKDNLRKKLGFLMTELGYKPGFLTTHAVLLGLSLEKRLAPRHRVLSILKEKDLKDYSFLYMAHKSEKQFLQMLERFKEDVPGLLELYESSKGCSNIDTISKRC